MRVFAAVVPLFVIFALTTPAFAFDQKPDIVVDKMVVKLVRGVTNVGTSVLEIPKQTIHSVRDRGPTGIVIGPIKGVVMTLYRALMGTTETVFFLVPAPGYYDPMMDPPYVWEDWASARLSTVEEAEPEPEAAPVEAPTPEAKAPTEPAKADEQPAAETKDAKPATDASAPAETTERPTT